MMKIIRLAFVFLLLTGITWAQEPKTLNMKIEGMTCGLCAMKVKKELSKICSDVSVDHKTGDGVCVDKEGKVASEQVLKAIENAGFRGRIVK